MKRLLGIAAALCALASGAHAQTQSVPYTFANQQGYVPASQLDADFSYLFNLIGGQTALMHVATNAALLTTPTTMAPVVVRDSFANYGDAPQLAYAASNSPCSLNGGNGDNGSQVKSSDSKCWLAIFPGIGADASEWGVDFTGVNSSDAAVAAAVAWGSTNSQPIVFKGGKVKLTGTQTIPLNNSSLICKGPMPSPNAFGATYGAQGTTFLLTSTSVQPFTLQTSVKVEGCNFFWPNQTGATAGTPITVTASPFTYTAPTNTNLPPFALVQVAGGTVSGITVGSTSTGQTSGVFNVPQGGTITVTYTGVPTMQNWSPVTYPPLFTEANIGCGTNACQVNGIEFDKVHLINAYDFLAESNPNDAFGQIRMTDVAGYAIHNFLTLSNAVDTVTINGVALGFALYQNSALFSAPPLLAQWTGANGAFLEVPNTGANSGNAGIFVSGAGIFGYGYGVHVKSGGVQGESSFDAAFDGVASLLKVDSGGCVIANRFAGVFYSYQVANGGSYASPWHGDNQPWISINASNGACAGGIEVSGKLEGSMGDILDVTGPGISNVNLHFAMGGAYGQSLTTGPYYIANVNAANLMLNISGSRFQPLSASSNYRGILLTNLYSAAIVGNNFNGVYAPLDVTSMATGVVNFTGNTTVASASTNSIMGSAATANVIAAGNYLDKPNPLIDGTLRLGSSTIDSTGTVTLNTPACASALGTGGSPSCVLQGGSSSYAGTVIFTTGSSGTGSSGSFTLTFPFAATHAPVCTASYQNGGGTWATTSIAPMAAVNSSTQVQIFWNNGAALTTSVTYGVNYTCHLT